MYNMSKLPYGVHMYVGGKLPNPHLDPEMASGLSLGILLATGFIIPLVPFCRVY